MRRRSSLRGQGVGSANLATRPSAQLARAQVCLLPSLPQGPLLLGKGGCRGRAPRPAHLCPCPPAPSAFLKRKRKGAGWVHAPHLPTGPPGPPRTFRAPASAGRPPRRLVPWVLRCLRKQHSASVVSRASSSGRPTTRVPRQAVFHGKGPGRKTSGKHPEGVVWIQVPRTLRDRDSGTSGAGKP